MQTANNAQTSTRDEQGTGTTLSNSRTGNPETGNAEETILNSQEQDEPLNETGMDQETGMETDDDTETMDEEELSSGDFENDDLEKAEEEEEEGGSDEEDEDQTGTHAPTMKGL